MDKFSCCHPRARLSWQGAGCCFWWQAGAGARYPQESLTGASDSLLLGIREQWREHWERRGKTSPLPLSAHPSASALDVHKGAQRLLPWAVGRCLLFTFIFLRAWFVFALILLPAVLFLQVLPFKALLFYQEGPCSKHSNKGSRAAAMPAARSVQAQEAGARIGNNTKSQGWKKTQELTLSCSCGDHGAMRPSVPFSGFWLQHADSCWVMPIQGSQAGLREICPGLPGPAQTKGQFCN